MKWKIKKTKSVHEKYWWPGNWQKQLGGGNIIISF